MKNFSPPGCAVALQSQTEEAVLTLCEEEQEEEEEEVHAAVF